jgi:hypothetical protein
MITDLVLRPALGGWADLARAADDGMLLGHPRREWRAQTRREVGLPDDRPVVATGHQTLLWHPGIFVKYLAMDAAGGQAGLATANLIVDQHVDDFGAYQVPTRRPDGTLGVRRIELTRPRADVPMSLHPAFRPAAPSAPGAALASVAEGVERIHAAIVAHAGAPNAAIQMAEALATLMSDWVAPAPHVTAGELGETALARAIMREMVRDPHRCAALYNEAVAPGRSGGAAGGGATAVRPLLIRDDHVELPLWRLRDDGRRMRAYDGDVEAALAGGADAPRLLPRALLMTALIRLGMCDLFIHGLGGASYDRAMERWIESWLGVTPAPIAVASATLRLPLRDRADAPPDVARAVADARRAWHDPESAAGDSGATPGPVKRELLEAVATAPARSSRRRAAFFAMHDQLATLRSANVGGVERRQRVAAEARRWVEEGAIADRRDWAFPLYPREMIDALRGVVVG